MKRRLSFLFSRIIVSTLLAIIGCLGFSSCKARTAKTAHQDKTERPDTASLVKPRPIPNDMGMVMYGTPTTTFEPKQIVVPDETEEKLVR